MSLSDLYIEEVTKKIPKKEHDKIAEDIRTRIDELLPENYTEEEEKAVLKKLGSPTTMASQYEDRAPANFISPRYFDLYISVLKMVIPIVLIIVFISVVAEFVIGEQGASSVLQIIIEIFSFGLARIITVGIQAFISITVIFFILDLLERKNITPPMNLKFKKWSPEDLKKTNSIPKKKVIPKSEVFWGLFGTAVWGTIYFYADHLIGIYQNGNEGLEFHIQVFNQDILMYYWPVVLLVIGIEVLSAMYKFIKKQWTLGVASFNIVHEMFAMIVFISILMEPNLLNPEFLQYLADEFAASEEQFNQWIKVVVSGIIIISAIISSITGFVKTRAKSSDRSIE